MWSPGAPCEAGVMIFCGTENQQKTNFPDTPNLGFGEWHLSPLWGQSHQRHFFTTSKTPKKKKKCTSRQPEPALRGGDHCALLCSAGCTITRPNLRQGGCIFKLGQLLRPPGKERYCDGPCCLAGGGLRSTGGFEATVSMEKPVFHYLTIHENEHKGGFHLKRSSGVRVGR